VAESIEQLSFELTASALAEQERALSGLRTRAGTVRSPSFQAGWPRVARCSPSRSSRGLSASSTKLWLWQKRHPVHHADTASAETEPADASPDDRAAWLRPPRKASPAVELDSETFRRQKLATRHPGGVERWNHPLPRRGAWTPRAHTLGPPRQRRADASQKHTHKNTYMPRNDMS